MTDGSVGWGGLIAVVPLGNEVAFTRCERHRICKCSATDSDTLAEDDEPRQHRTQLPSLNECEINNFASAPRFFHARLAAFGFLCQPMVMTCPTPHPSSHPSDRNRIRVFMFQHGNLMCLCFHQSDREWACVQSRYREYQSYEPSTAPYARHNLIQIFHFKHKYECSACFMDEMNVTDF